MSANPPTDQAHGLRRLFAHAQVRFIPVISNPHLALGGVMLERLCAGFTERGIRTLVVDASERANEPSEMAMLDLAECIEPLSAHVSYIAARGLPVKFVDATGSTHGFLHTITQAAPQSQVVLIHAAASDVCRLFGRSSRLVDAKPVCPLLLADDHPSSVTHAYAAMKLLVQRAGLMVHELMLGAADDSPRAERIATQLAICADDFLGAVLRDWVRVDPSTQAGTVPTAALRHWVRDRLRVEDDADRIPTAATLTEGYTMPSPAGSRFAASNRAFN